jgi:hypothetical protein
MNRVFVWMCIVAERLKISPTLGVNKQTNKIIHHILILNATILFMCRLPICLMLHEDIFVN